MIIFDFLIALSIQYLLAFCLYSFLSTKRKDSVSQLKFLNKYYDTIRRKGYYEKEKPYINKKLIQSYGSHGWFMLGLPVLIISLSEGLTTLSYAGAISSLVLLYFGASFFATAWFAKKILDINGWKQYSPTAPEDLAH